MHYFVSSLVYQLLGYISQLARFNFGIAVFVNRPKFNFFCLFQFWYFRDDKYLQAENWYACVRRSDTLKLCEVTQREEWSYNPVSCV